LTTYGQIKINNNDNNDDNNNKSTCKMHIISRQIESEATIDVYLGKFKHQIHIISVSVKALQELLCSQKHRHHKTQVIEITDTKISQIPA